jgi:hypothetical protein
MAIEAGLGVTEMETKTAVVPLPLSDTVCGLFTALSVTDNVVLRLPVTEGSKVTETVQFPPPASVLGDSGQVEVAWKSARPVAILAIVRAVV